MKLTARERELVASLFRCRYRHENSMSDAEADEYAVLAFRGLVDADRLGDCLVFSVKVLSFAKRAAA